MSKSSAQRRYRGASIEGNGTVASRSSSTKLGGAPRASFRADIEGLRAIAVLLVLLDHAGVAAFGGGYIGVDVFFVLSGFLITGLLVHELETTGRISLINFYARRARRLLPAGTLVLVVTVLASSLVLGGIRAKSVAIDAQWAALFASNLRFIQQGTDYLNAELPPSPLQHFWSLAVEEQFYVVWPVLMIAVARVGTRISLRRRLGLALSLVVIASLVWSWRQSNLDGTTAYFSPLTRAHELAAGGLLALATPWLRAVPRRLGLAAAWAGVVGIGVAGVWFDATTIFPGIAAMLPVGATALMVAGGTAAPGGTVERLLGLAPFQIVGRYSYSLYLWHWPLLVIVPVWAGREFTTAENLVLCGLAFALAAATFAVLEHPVRDSRWLRARPALASVGLGVTLVVLSLGVARGINAAATVPSEGEVSQPASPSPDGVLATVAASIDDRAWPPQPARIKNVAYEGGCNVTRADTSTEICVHGDPEGSRTMVVLGDSHAAMWIPALDVIGKERGWQVIQLTKPGCQAPDFPRYSTSFKREYTECGEFRAWALDRIDEIRPDLVVISSMSRGARWMKDGEGVSEGLERPWADGLAAVIQRISPVSERIVVIGDMAYPREQGIECLTRNPGNALACGAEMDYAVIDEFQALEREVAEANGAEFVDVIPWFCADGFCPAVIGGLTVHRDRLHVAENYVVWLSEALAAALRLT